MSKEYECGPVLSFSQYTETLDNTLSRALKVHAGIFNIGAEKTRTEWDYLLYTLKTKPLTR